MKNTDEKRISWSYLGIGLAVLVVLILLFRQPVYDKLYSWDLIPKPEAYTELYFTETPPGTFVPAQQTTVAFTLRNVEYQTTSYTYVIEQLDASGTVLAQLAKDTISLKQDASKSLAVPITFIDNDATAKVRVTITFIEKNKTTPTMESIYYLVKRGES